MGNNCCNEKDEQQKRHSKHIITQVNTTKKIAKS